MKNNYQYLSAKMVLLVLLTLAGLRGLAQQRTLTGKITGDRGEALPGATVLLKGTTTGTSTNADGNYTIPIPADQANGTLVVSFIGYLSKEIVIGNQSVIDVSIDPDAKGLQEVIVVGYGTQKKESLTGAISAVTSRDVGRVHAATVHYPGRVRQIQGGH